MFDSSYSFTDRFSPVITRHFFVITRQSSLVNTRHFCAVLLTNFTFFVPHLAHVDVTLLGPFFDTTSFSPFDAVEALHLTQYESPMVQLGSTPSATASVYIK